MSPRKKKTTKVTDMVRTLADIPQVDEPRRSISLRVDGKLYDRAKERFGNKVGTVFEALLRDALDKLDEKK